MKRFILLASFLGLIFGNLVDAKQAGVRLKDLARFDGVRENALVGYGLVVGLAGTGDSQRNKATIQSIGNTLQSFGVLVQDRELVSRNVAAVMVTATLPAFAEKGDKLDINVSSLGDAKSLVGGTLLLVPLKAPNDQIFALAQGPLSVGGFKYDLFGNVVQKNHPTVGLVPEGATVERSVNSDFVNKDGEVKLILNDPDFTTVERIVNAISAAMPSLEVQPIHAGKISIETKHLSPMGRFQLFSKLEKMIVHPDIAARVIINERTGTVVAGGNVVVNEVTVSHGNLRLEIKTDFNVSQPFFIGRNRDSNIETAITPSTTIDVKETEAEAVQLGSGTSVADLIASLKKLNTSTRDIITILQAIKRAGALHADLVIQ